MVGHMDRTDLLRDCGIILGLWSPVVSKDGRCTSDGLFKQGFKESRAVASVAQPVEEKFDLENEVGLISDKGKIPVYHTNYCTLQNPWGVTA